MGCARGGHPPYGRVTGGGRRGAKTAGTTPTTGCATPPGGVGVDRRREIPRIVAASLRDDHFSVPLKKKWGFSPFFGMWDRIIVVARVSSNNAVSFSASIHSHTTWGRGAPGGWGGGGGLAPPRPPPRDPAIWWVTPAGPPHGGHISKL